MSDGSLGTLVKKSILKDSDFYQIKEDIRKVLEHFSFFGKGVTLQITDPSYKLRYRFALKFWQEKTNNGAQTLSRVQANKLIRELSVKLDSKYDLYKQEEIIDIDGIKDEVFLKDRVARRRSSTESNKPPVSYVTSKCENKFYVKPADKSRDEIEFNREDIECSYNLICPGDEVQIKSSGGKRSLYITKSTGLTSQETDVANFIQDLSDRLFSGESGLTVFNILCRRYQGIWNHIKNDTELFEDIECIKKLWRLSFLLSRKLLRSVKIISLFLEDLSSSSFFTTTLPRFIKDNASKLNSDEVQESKLLLESIIKFVPQTARKTWKVAEYLAHAMYRNNITSNATALYSRCQGVEFLAYLGKKLATSIPGYQDVDTTNFDWNELPTIPTKKEILTEFNLDSLDSIKVREPYESTEQYLDINFRLLREECFRNLCTGIQNFREHNSDAQTMNFYKITLESVHGGNTQAFLVLSCEDYYEKESEDSEDIETTSNEILYGSLMCISLNKNFADNFIWATVVEYEHQKDSDKKTVSVKLCSNRNKKDDIDVFSELALLTSEGDHALMAESPTFFGALGPCMDRLKEIHEREDMPFVDELVLADNKAGPPEYTHDKQQKCDWSIIFEEPIALPQDQQLSPVEQYRHLKNVEKSRSFLDETQMLAIENFLENRVSLIQGPPGTGKSFLGAKILRLMLSMQLPKLYDGPILVMTYKNFALDHFLQTCLEHTTNVVRIGKAGNTDLEKINLRKVREEIGIKEELLEMKLKATEEMKSSLLIIQSLFKCLSNNVSIFLEAASEHHIRSLLTPPQHVSENTPGDSVDVDDLLTKWKQKIVPQQLKELVQKNLDRWLPRDEKIRRNCTKFKTDLLHSKKKSISVFSNDNDEEYFEEVIDKNVVDQERRKDAVENDVLNTQSDTEKYYDGPSLPFVCKNEEDTEEEVDENCNLWDLSDSARVNVFSDLRGKIVVEFKKAVYSYESNAQIHQNILDERTVEVLKQYDVIAMTISGAATRLHLLNEVKPCAVIVEEAAEIIEGQLISVLPPTIRHLVMLGDHQQLKPSVSCYKLKKKKNLDCSMFERLINNKMPFQQLGQQCRMRHDIAALLRSLNIYKDLDTNFEETKDNNPPDCVGRSLYFVKHTRAESLIPGTKSVWNQKEIDHILHVAEYLMKNKVLPDEVTVLCPYRAQVQKMKAAFQKQSSISSKEHVKKLACIQITTVDSFQGEENKVILLSLVRSNEKRNIGFFSEKNRICVAISRARCGLYIFGDISVYDTSQDWKKIIDLLQEQNLVGTKFLPFKDESDGVNPRQDQELFGDTSTRKLSDQEIDQLAPKLVDKWEDIAGLAELDPVDVESVKFGHVRYPQPKDKAKKILTLISENANFSRKELDGYLKELGFLDLVEEVSPLEDEGSFCDTTRLSLREISRLSSKIVKNWQEIAGLANLDPNEVENVKLDHVNYQQPKDKARKILTMINKKDGFSREELCGYLKESGFHDLVNDVIHGKLRNVDTNDADKSVCH